MAMAETCRQPSLGVLEHAVGVEADVDRALAVLAEFGLSEPDPELRNAVAVALMHSSYLYENQTAFPELPEDCWTHSATLAWPSLGGGPQSIPIFGLHLRLRSR